jgi:hypothetical protein
MLVMKKFISMFVLALLLVGSSAFAQTNILVDIKKAKLTWNWAPDSAGDIVDSFSVKCGPATGVYTRNTPVLFPNTELDLVTAIFGVGTWFCTVSAVNQFGESPDSNEVAFSAGTTPGGKLTTSAVRGIYGVR